MYLLIRSPGCDNQPTPPALAHGVLGAETSHANLPLAPNHQAKQLIPLTQFWQVPHTTQPLKTQRRTTIVQPGTHWKDAQCWVCWVNMNKSMYVFSHDHAEDRDKNNDLLHKAPNHLSCSATALD